MFNAKEKSTTQKTVVATRTTSTMIGKTVRVEGNFTSQEDIIVAGTLTGSLTTNQNFILEAEGKVLADVSAKNANIQGEVQGNVMVQEKLEIHSSGMIRGDIKANVIVVQEGGKIIGNVQIGTETGKSKAKAST